MTTSSCGVNLLRKRPYAEDDLDYNWRNAKQQRSFGTEYIRFEPMGVLEEQPKQIEIEISNSRPIKFDHQTRFQVKVELQTRNLAPAGSDADKRWHLLKTEVDKADSKELDEVCLAPNWFENLITSIDIYHQNNRVTAHDESPMIGFQLNTFLYHMSSPAFKKSFCPQNGHPGRGIPTKLGNWGPGKAEWKTYAAHLVKNNQFTFHYVPMHTFPFHQNPNWMVDGKQKDLPLDKIGKMYCRINFKNDWSCVWKKIKKYAAADATRTTDINMKEYRIVLKELTLLAEEDRINPGMLQSKTSGNYRNGGNAPIAFYGVSRDSRCEAIKDGESVHRVRFQRNAMPETMFIFAVNRKVIGGTWNYQEVDDNQPLFMKHNIEEIQVTYDGQTFTNKEPNFMMFKHDQQALAYMENVMRHGYFGMHVDPDKINYEEIVREHENSLFPHIFVSFLTNNNKNASLERIQTIQDTQGNAYKQDAAIEIQLKFDSNGAATNATYVVYFGYTDVNMTWDPKSFRFVNRYKNFLL